MPQKKPKIEITARITMPDGQVIESSAVGGDTIPLLDDFDLSTRDGLLKDFDALEKNIVSTRDDAVSSLTEKYMGEVSKKNRARNPKNPRQ